MIRLALAGLLLGLAGAGQAATLRIGMQGDPTSLDPQFFNSTANDSYARDVYDRLVDTDAKGAVIPALSDRWRLVDPTTWEFELRPGITFSDGTLLTADDVVFSMKRGCCIPNSPYSLNAYLRGKTFQATGPLTLRVTTPQPSPTMLEDMARISIVSAGAGEKATADYNAGRGSPGTGPYRLVERVPGDRVVLDARTDWWGGKPAWDRVVIRAIPQDASRVAALLSGDVDVIDGVPPPDAARLRSGDASRLDTIPANRMVHLRLDEARARTADITAADGSPIDNPLRKLLVRQALVQAINREALVDRVMEGLAVPATQFAIAGSPNHLPEIVALPYDPAAARAKLAQAGYPDGFRLVLRGPNDRVVNDRKTVEAVAQMFTRIGVRTEVDTTPSAMFFPRVQRNEFSLFLNTWGLYDLVNTVLSNLHTPNGNGGYGSANTSAYSNAAIDHLSEQGAMVVDEPKRREILLQAVKIGMEDVALIPLFNLVNAWGTRKSLAYEARNDGTTVAQGVRAVAP